MQNTRILSSRVIRRISVQAMRSQSTSTMGLSSQGSHDFGEKTSTIATTNYERKGFSTAVASYEFDLEIQPYQSSRMLGVEMDPVQAASAVKAGDVFDKIIILMSHGEVCDKDENETMFNTALTGKGIGHAMNISRETSIFCTKKSGLVPELFVVSPERSTTESALVAFPQYAPGSIFDIPWVCHKQCTDTNLETSSGIESIDETFPGIDFSSLKNSENTDFLSWLSERDEKIIVVSSTETWINNFVGAVTSSNSIAEEVEGNVLLRSVGIKF